eukprot:GHVU01049922.1.p3 GENE.GHVU01049922.1~~GHVU01049922.1.p3  ORF type:complete len:103 (-),score=7.55 GHVU01049922.1:863-1171(-)
MHLAMHTHRTMCVHMSDVRIKLYISMYVYIACSGRNALRLSSELEFEATLPHNRLQCLMMNESLSVVLMMMITTVALPHKGRSVSGLVSGRVSGRVSEWADE